MLVQRLSRARLPRYDATAEHSLPGWAGAVFEAALDAERLMIRWGVSLPVGGSRIVVARLV